MTHGLHSLTRTGAPKAKRVGRGQASGRGKTAGRGTKGQKARAGHKIRPELRDIIKKIPKRRGYGKNRSRTVDGTRPNHTAVSLERLEIAYSSGETVSKATLIEKSILTARRANFAPIKILGDGTLSKKLTITGLATSASAKSAIEKAGGSVA